MGYFKNEMLTKIKSCINKFLLEYEHELIGLEAHLSEISGDIEKCQKVSVMDLRTRGTVMTVAGRVLRLIAPLM